MLHFLERAYGWLLHAYPPDLRRAHAAEMRQCARAALAARGIAATWLPARRASALDPIRALRQE